MERRRNWANAIALIKGYEDSVSWMVISTLENTFHSVPDEKAEETLDYYMTHITMNWGL